jgi:hypothetical protein
MAGAGRSDFRAIGADLAFQQPAQKFDGVTICGFGRVTIGDAAALSILCGLRAASLAPFQISFAHSAHVTLSLVLLREASDEVMCKGLLFSGAATILSPARCNRASIKLSIVQEHRQVHRWRCSLFNAV